MLRCRHLPLPSSTWPTFLWRLIACVGCAILVGCDTTAPQPETTVPESAATQRPLKLLVVDAPNMGEAARREWSSRASRPIEIEPITSEALRNQLGRNALKGDAILYPVHLLGELAEKQVISPAPMFALDPDAFDGDWGLQSDVLPLARTALAKWGKQVYAVPLGAETLALFARRDIVSSLNASAPATWADFSGLLQTYEAQRPSQQDWPTQGLVLPLAEGWAAPTMLAISAASIRHNQRYSALFNLRSLEPAIANPAFVDAATWIRERADAGSLDLTPATAVDAVKNGQAAFAIGWLGRGPDESDSDHPITIWNLPGSQRYYSAAQREWQERSPDEIAEVPLALPNGMVASVLTSSKSQKASWSLVIHLGGREWGHLVAAKNLSLGPIRSSQISANRFGYSLPSEALEELANTKRHSLEQRLALTSLRVPSAQKYLTALDQRVRQIVAEDAAVQAALNETAQKWEEITASLDREAQVKAYQRNLGLDPQ